MEKEHKTDGSKCWCNPKIVSYRDYTCPICKGKGKLEPPQAINWKKQAITCLYKNGFGIRQIQRLLGYKSPQSVSYLLRNIKNL